MESITTTALTPEQTQRREIIQQLHREILQIEVAIARLMVDCQHTFVKSEICGNVEECCAICGTVKGKEL